MYIYMYTHIHTIGRYSFMMKALCISECDNVMEVIQ